MKKKNTSKWIQKYKNLDKVDCQNHFFLARERQFLINNKFSQYSELPYKIKFTYTFKLDVKYSIIIKYRFLEYDSKSDVIHR